MVRYAKSKTRQSRENLEEYETKIQNALIVYKKEQDKPKSLRRGLRKVAEEFGISHSTLHSRYTGIRSISKANSDKQKLTVHEEETLVDVICTSSDWGIPLSSEEIIVYANELIKKVHDGVGPVGKSWFCRFLIRHHTRLHTYWGKPLDTQRAKSLNPTAVNGWFDILEREIVGKEVAPENIYGMDESGFPPSDQGSRRVVGRAGNRLQHKSGGANRENVTALVTICADGTTLPPLVVFKGERLLGTWCRNNVANMR